MMPMTVTTVLIELLSKAMRANDTDTSKHPKQQNDEEERVNLEKLKIEARVAQEIAIAHRIESANKVEIEEYYDTSGSGSIGVKGSGEGINIGATGQGQRVSKRIYRFTGWKPDDRNDATEKFTQNSLDYNE